MGAIYYKICIDSYEIYLLECFTSPLIENNNVLKNIWKNHMRFELGIARFGVQHFTSGLPVSVAAGVYDLVVYLG